MMEDRNQNIFDKMDYIGGKNINSIDELNNIGFIIPPNIPQYNQDGGGEWHKLPELRSSEVNEVLSQPPNWLIS
jgi:hypothetical protein